MQTLFTTDRIARLFVETWRKVPATQRAKIEARLAYITDNPSFMPWCQQEADDGARLGIAYADWGLNAVVLFPDRLAAESDREVKFTIAHELAHVYLGHVPTFDEAMGGKAIADKPEEIQRCETEANFCVLLWKIPTDAKDKAPVLHGALPD